MKKFITLMVLAAASISAYGASINWNISGINNALDNYTGGAAANTTVYLVLGDAASKALLTSSTQLSTDFFSALAGITINTVTAAADGKKPVVTADIISTSPLLTAGTSYIFGMLYVSEDAMGNGFYAWVQSDAVAYNYDPEDTSNSSAVGLSWSSMNSSAWTQGYAPVPEPATAALALAGLAMLIRRRK